MKGLMARLRIRWALRNCPDTEVREMLTLVILAGRRCTHDLGHALSEMPQSSDWHQHLRSRLHAKHYHWMKVFYPDDGAKRYRDRLHYQLDEARSQVERLENLCRANGIDPTDPKGIPF